ncbi:hypothetical protein HanRHA438_Chr12g0558741 [Helianthus annuus]|nr:hypothetical protein HanRHA438_Chr12g0558741 [Helianthus annuus]
MPMLWRVLLILDQIKNAHIPNLSIHDFPLAYRLKAHGSSRFLFYSTSNDPLILQATRNEEEWKSKFFFVKRSSIPGGADYPVKWLRRADFRKLAPPLADSEKRIQAIRLLPEIERSFILYPASSSQHSSSNMSDASKVPILLDLEELDNYPTPVQVKKETLTITSSKPAAAPKPNPRTRASTSKKRKGSETTAPASEGFSYEELSFTESLEPMTSFLNKARIKMAYEARERGLKCPSWPVDSWVAKLKDLGGNHVSYLAKAGVGEASKAAEVVDEAREKKDAGDDAGQDAAQDVVAEEVKKDGGDAAV